MSVVVSTKNSLAWAGSTAPTYVADGVELIYSSDGDTNGAFYYIGSNGGVSGWVNPITNLFIGAVASSSTSNTISTLADRAATAFYVNAMTNAFVGFDLGVTRVMAVKKYTIRSRSEASHNMKNWKLQGSNNVGGTDATAYTNASWEDIDERVNDTFLINADAYHTYTSNINPSKRFRWIRILQNGLNHSNGEYLCLGEVELYGNLKTIK